MIAEAEAAKAGGAQRFCMGAAWRDLKDRDLPKVSAMIAGVKALGLETCATLGMLKPAQAEALKAAGLDYYNHNLDSSPEYYERIITTRTFQDRLDTLQAAVLLAKLEVFDEELTARAEIADRYNALLKDAVHTPRVLADRTSVWAQYTIEVDDRESVETALHGAEIPTAVHYPTPLHLQPVFTELSYEMDWARGSFPVAERAAERVLSLPMHPYLTPPQIERVAETVKVAVRGPVGRAPRI